MGHQLMTNTQDKVAVVAPRIPKDVLDYLKQAFPEESAKLHWSLDEIRHKGGQVSVVQHLEEQYRQQNENILTPTPSKSVPSQLSKDSKNRSSRTSTSASN